MKQTEKTTVVFRAWRGGNKGIIALFPELAADSEGHCDAYEHIGQHGGADYDGVIAQTRPATPAEYADLAAELTRIGYDLKIIARATPRMRDERERAARN
jgi:hypothetical protein